MDCNKVLKTSNNNECLAKKHYKLHTHPLKGPKAHQAPWNTNMKTREAVLANKRASDMSKGYDFKPRAKTSAKNFGSYYHKEPCARPTRLPSRDEMKRPKLHDHLDRWRCSSVYYCYVGSRYEEY